MPSPSSSLATQRPDLAGSLVEFNLAMDRQGFIGLQVAPVLEVAKQAGNFGRIPLAQLLQHPQVDRAPGAGYNRRHWKFVPDTYQTLERGEEEPVDDREATMYREYLDAEEFAAARAYDAVLRAQEVRCAALFYDPTRWTGSDLATGITHEWDDASNAVPINDVEAAVRKVWANSGIWPDTLIVNRLQFRNLRQCTQILNRISASGAGSGIKATDVTLAMLSAVFDLPKIRVAGGAQNTANEGADAAISQIWSDEYAMVCKTADTRDVREPCIARTFHWDEDGSVIGGAIEEYREEQSRSKIIRVRHDVGEKVMYTEMGHLLSNVTTI